jgi:hypothetical protein
VNLWSKNDYFGTSLKKTHRHLIEGNEHFPLYVRFGIRKWSTSRPISCAKHCNFFPSTFYTFLQLFFATSNLPKPKVDVKVDSTTFPFVFFACQGFITFHIFVTFSNCFVVLCGSSFVFFYYMRRCFLLILFFCMILPLLFVFLCVNDFCLFCCFTWFFLYLNFVFVHQCSPFVLLLCTSLLFFVSMCVDVFWLILLFCMVLTLFLISLCNDVSRFFLLFSWFFLCSLCICALMFLLVLFYTVLFLFSMFLHVDDTLVNFAFINIFPSNVF